VVLDLGLFGWLVAFALGGDHMEQLRTGQASHRPQRGQQLRQIVAVDRAGVMEAEFLEQGRGYEHALGVFFPAAEETPHEGFLRNGALGPFAPDVERGAGHGPRHHLGQRADVLADRHAVVIEHDEHVWLDIAAMVQRLESHARGHRAVADHRDDLAVVALALGGDGHAERGRDRG
jgi:hypothetical protein